MTRTLLPLLFIALAGDVFANAPSKDYQIKFSIHDPKSDKQYFTGYEDITHNEGKVTKKAFYYDDKKKLLQTEFVVFDQNTLKVLDYDYDNRITGEASKLNVVGNKVKITYVEKAGEKPKLGEMSWEDNMYHGKTFHQLILRNWKTLSQGKEYDFSLLIPYRFESIDFQIVNKGKTKKDGKEVTTIAIEPDSFLIRQFAPKLEAEYAIVDGCLKF